MAQEAHCPALTTVQNTSEILRNALPAVGHLEVHEAGAVVSHSPPWGQRPPGSDHDYHT